MTEPVMANAEPWRPPARREKSLADAWPMPVARVWARLGLPRADRWLASLGVWDRPRWKGQPIRLTRGKWHLYTLALDLSDLHQRGVYFYGRMFDVEMQLTLLELLRPGDVCVDVGANIGLVTLLAAHAVGPGGQVLAFEPNPRIFERLRWHVSTNRVAHARPFALGLSDHSAVARLSIPPTGNTGAATLGTLPKRFKGKTAAEYDVTLVVGDDVPEIAALRAGTHEARNLLIKLDVEGHECSALRGLAQTIRSCFPAILLECNPPMLRGNGSSARELMDLVRSWGYVAWQMDRAWSRWARRWRVRVHRADGQWIPDRTTNVLFVRPGSIFEQRLSRIITG